MSSTPSLLSDSLKGASSRWPAILQAWLPPLLFACVIALESTAALGANHTSAPLHSFFHLLFGQSVDRNWSFLHHMLRKTGHFAGYGMLSLVVFRGFSVTMRTTATRVLDLDRDRVCHVLAIAAAFLVASADEFHQSFLPNRTGCFRDVLLDTAGAVALQLAFMLAVRAIALLKASRHVKRKLQASRAVSFAA